MTNALEYIWYNNLLLIPILLCGLICCDALRKETAVGFLFDGFGNNVSFNSEIIIHGDAEISGDVVRLTRPTNSSLGLMIYREPVRFWGTKPGFSAYVSFSVSPQPSGNCGWLSFFFVPRSVQLELRAVVSSAISIELFYPNCSMAANGSEKLILNGSESLIRINVGRHAILKRYNVSTAKLVLKDGQHLHSWIDYDGALKRIEVRFSRSKDSRPMNSSVSLSINLSNVMWREAMLVGLSSSNGNYSQSCKVYAWSFSVNHGAPFPMHSEPLDPNNFLVHSHASSPVHMEGANCSWRMLIAMLLSSAFGALVTIFAMFLWIKLVNRHPMASVECSVHPVDFVDEKIVLAEDKDVEGEKKSSNQGREGEAN